MTEKMMPAAQQNQSEPDCLLWL